ncbi:MAG: S8 family serine peptidase [Deltaproteobacteria bacterium]|nr:S8 family serine peptidase [Deltaproteobacteria bacterium]
MSWKAVAAWVSLAVLPVFAPADDRNAQRAAEERTEVFVLLHDPMAGARDIHSRRQRITQLQRRVADEVAGPAVTIEHMLHLVSGFTASVSSQGLARLRSHPDVVRVDPVKYGSGALSHSVPQIRADAVHRRDDDGQTVTVAILDTGIDASDIDLAGSVAAEQCFCSGCCPNGKSEQSGDGSARTYFLHGNHVAGILLSQGIVAPAGVAPRTKLVAVKVLDDRNRGALSDWIRALDWIALERPDVQAINMSLVTDEVYPGACDQTDSFNMAFAQIIAVLRARGVLTFISAGNTGELEAIGSPACIHDAIAVGAVTPDDFVADFSDVSSELDILAPGVEIVSSGLKCPGDCDGNGEITHDELLTLIDVDLGIADYRACAAGDSNGTEVVTVDEIVKAVGHSIAGCPNGTIATLTGTSMAAPHVTGTAALLLALNPGLSADALEALLKQRSTPVFDDRVGTIYPRVNALAAMTAVLPTSRPFTGGGSRGTDCLLEWNVGGSPRVEVSPRLALECHDNDTGCDQDAVPGQCTFGISTCLNVTDYRLPHCATASSLRSIRLISPSPTASDPTQRSNAAALLAVLPRVPSTSSNQCSPTVQFVVAAGTSQWIRMTITAGDGRHDADRMQLVCKGPG